MTEKKWCYEILDRKDFKQVIKFKDGEQKTEFLMSCVTILILNGKSVVTSFQFWPLKSNAGSVFLSLFYSLYPCFFCMSEGNKASSSSLETLGLFSFSEILYWFVWEEGSLCKYLRCQNFIKSSNSQRVMLFVEPWNLYFYHYLKLL